MTSVAADPVQTVLDALSSRDCRPRRSGAGWSARCPAHDDKNPSLTVGAGDDGRALVNCQRGCTFDEVVHALDLRPADLMAQGESNGHNSGRPEIVETYPYVDEAGHLLFEVVRMRPKTFRQRHPRDGGGWTWKMDGVRRVLYRLPEVVEAINAEVSVFVVEGEKDVHALERAGYTATCNPGGAGKWRPEYTETLRGADVRIVADKDDTGRAHARQVAAALDGVATQVFTYEALTGKDAADHLAAGHTVEELVPVDLVPVDLEAPAEAPAPDTPQVSDDGREKTTWAPIELAEHQHDRSARAEPTVLARGDGIRLTYPGKVNAFFGESESAKSFAALIAAAQEMAAGNHVLWIDFEDDDITVTDRLTALGVPWDTLRALFHYIHPEEPIVDTKGRIGAGHLDLQEALDCRPTLAVVDGVTEAMSLHGFSSDSGDDYARLNRALLRYLADRGPAVITIDHVTKDRESRGKYAIGTQHKRAATTGAALGFDMTTAFGKGRTGIIRITIAKDKPGSLRQHANGKTIAELHMTANHDGTSITYQLRVPPATTVTDEHGEPAFRPTHLMEKVSRMLELGGPLSARDLRRDIKSRAEHIDAARTALAREGYIAIEKAGNGHVHRHLRPYREADEIASGTTESEQ